MKRLLWIGLAIVLVAMMVASARSAEVSEQAKIEALKLGYILNGDSMVRWGSIDLTDPAVLNEPRAMAPVRVIPTDAKKAKR